MKITVGKLLPAYTTLTAIINEHRPLPMKANYRMARMHAKLASDFKTASDQYDALVVKFGTPVMKQVEKKSDVADEIIVDLVPTGNFKVDPNTEAMTAFTEAWKLIADEEIECDVQPIPIECMGDSSSIAADEFIALGPLVSE